jgi:hypothetical protein
LITLDFYARVAYIRIPAPKKPLREYAMPDE